MVMMSKKDKKIYRSVKRQTLSKNICASYPEKSSALNKAKILKKAGWTSYIKKNKNVYDVFLGSQINRE